MYRRVNSSTRLVAVGPTREILKWAGPATRRIELNGRTATPGLIDAHAHIAEVYEAGPEARAGESGNGQE